MGERKKGWNGSVRKMRCNEGMGQRGGGVDRVSDEKGDGTREYVKGKNAEKGQ